MKELALELDAYNKQVEELIGKLVELHVPFQLNQKEIVKEEKSSVVSKGKKEKLPKDSKGVVELQEEQQNIEPDCSG